MPPYVLSGRVQDPLRDRGSNPDFFLAGAPGLEPGTKVLEAFVLPLHHTPIVSTCQGSGNLSNHSYPETLLVGPFVQQTKKLALFRLAPQMIFKCREGLREA